LKLLALKLLLDTRVLLWWLADSRRLGMGPRKLIQRSPLVVVSAASAWEISIKKTLGKLSAPDDLAGQLEASRFQELPITVRHARAAGALPRHHDDPFDRMLVAQAQAEGLALLTHDESLRIYGEAVVTCSSIG